MTAVDHNASTGTCARCNGPTAKFTNGKFKKFCSRACTWGKTPFDAVAAATPAKCGFCGKRTKRRPDGTANKWCSLKCIQRARNKGVHFAEGHQCASCGGQVRKYSNGRIRKTCSIACSQRADLLAKRAPPATGRQANCIACGADFVSIRPTKGGLWPKYCGQKCQRKFLDRKNAAPFCTVYFVKCIQCGTPGVARNAAMKRFTCGRQCATKEKRQQSRKLSERRSTVDRSPRKCKECGTSFARDYGWARQFFCGARCSKKSARRGSTHTHRQRAKRKGVRIGTVNRLRVFARCNWQCAICECATPRSLNGTHEPNAPELDHVMPIARGGDHVESNTQLLCRTCNHRKGAELQTEELVNQLRALRKEEMHTKVLLSRYTDGMEIWTTRGAIEYIAGVRREVERNREAAQK